MKILIAEDDLTTRVVLQLLLTKWGYEVTGTDNGEEAYAIFQEEGAPSLALLDWEMPGLDGAALCKRLREQNHKKPLYLILLTSRGGRKDIAQGLAAGADDYISKPYDNTELQARIGVGKRVIRLQNQMLEQEKLRGVLEMAGAICHELNQPLQVVMGFAEILLLDLKTDDPNYNTAQKIKIGMDRIGALTRKMMKITRYQSKPYLKSKIIDIDHSSGDI